MATKASMVTPEEARNKAGKVYQRRLSSWASQIAWERVTAELALAVPCTLGSKRFEDAPRCPLDDSDSSASEEAAVPTFESSTLTVPLHPPTEAMALRDSNATRVWVEKWRAAGKTLPKGARLAWSSRHWPSVGTQDVPERILFENAHAIASFSGKARHWSTLTSRIEELCAIAVAHSDNAREAGNLAFAVDFVDAARKTSSKIANLDKGDWELFKAAFTWLIQNPSTYCYVRELPIPGIHTKWVESNRSTLLPMVESVTGQKPSFRTPPHQARVHVLDPTCAPAGMLDFQASPLELSRLETKPKRVLIVENLTTTLALPPIPGAWAIWGSGYAVTELSDIAWIRQIPVFYWGDIDTHGFAILNALRCHLPDVRSILMDRETLCAHLEFCVEEPTYTAAALPNLTMEESETYQALSNNDGTAIDPCRKEGNPSNAAVKHKRLEQERIGWPYALSAIRDRLQE